MNGDPAPATPAGPRHDHLDIAPRWPTQPMKRSSGPMARDSVGPARQNRGHVAGVWEQQRMADCVHAGVDPMQTPSFDASPYRVPAQSDCQQLIAAHDRVLASRQSRHPHLRPRVRPDLR